MCLLMRLFVFIGWLTSVWVLGYIDVLDMRDDSGGYLCVKLVSKLDTENLLDTLSCFDF